LKAADLPKHPKRPRDLNQWAKHMLDIATGEASDRELTPEERGVAPAASAVPASGALGVLPASSGAESL
jgi:hypothetical protein